MAAYRSVEHHDADVRIEDPIRSQILHLRVWHRVDGYLPHAFAVLADGSTVAVLLSGLDIK